MRRLSAPLVLLVLAGAIAASASDDPPRARSASAQLRLPSLKRCVIGSNVRIGLVPPADTSFAALSVRVRSSEVVQLAGLTGPGSIVVALPRGRARVRVSATTGDGQFLTASQRYRRCTAAERDALRHPKPKRRPHPTATPQEKPDVKGGGEP